MEADIEEKKQKIDEFNERNKNVYYFYKKYLHNQVQELKGNIRVFCWVRPVLKGVDSAEDIEKSSNEFL